MPHSHISIWHQRLNETFVGKRSHRSTENAYILYITGLLRESVLTWMHLLAVGDGLGILDLEDDTGLFTAAAAGTGDLQGGGGAGAGTEEGATLSGGGGLSLDRGGFVGCRFG